MRCLSLFLVLALALGRSVQLSEDGFGDDHYGDDYLDDDLWDDEEGGGGADRADQAQAAQQKAIEVAERGDLKGSLPHFERAARLAPTVANHW